MAGKAQPLRQRSLHFVPILIGSAGVLFSMNMESNVLKSIVLLFSVGVPLFAVGFVMTHMHGRRTEKILLITGSALLTLGAVTNILGLSGSLTETTAVPEAIWRISQWIGTISLVLGLGVVLWLVTRIGDVFETFTDRFRHLADHMEEGFAVLSVTGHATLVNKSLLEMLDLSEEDVIGRHVSEVASQFGVRDNIPTIDPEDLKLFLEYDLTVPVRGEKRTLHINAVPIFDRPGFVTGRLLTIRDITKERDMAEKLESYTRGLQQLVEEQTQKLRESEDVFRNLLVHMNEGFITIDENFVIDFANDMMCKLLGLEHDKIAGSELFDFVEASSRERLLGILEYPRYVQSAPKAQEIVFTQPDGHTVHTVVAVAPVEEPGDEKQCYSLVVTDVSELKEMQKSIEQRAEALEVANEELKMHGRARDTFLSNVGHELKTPLSTIRGYMEMLQEGTMGELSGPQLGALKVMARNTERLLSLIEELLTFSRMEIKGIALARSLFSARDLVQECVNSATPQTLLKNLSLNSYVPDDFPYVWGDRTRLAQTLTILLSNAAKFTPEGGSIHVNVVQQDDNTCALSVSDTGIGIDEKYHQRVYDKFFQVDGSLSRHYEGAGIGLSLAKSITLAHDGLIELESEAGKGCTFKIVLPNSIFNRSAELKPGMPKKLRLLVADCAPSFSQALAELSESVGWSVDTAEHIYACIRKAQETKPDVMLIDGKSQSVAEPGHVLELQQAVDGTSGSTIVFLEQEKLEANAKILASSHVALLPKPFTSEAFLEVVTHAHKHKDEFYAHNVQRIARKEDQSATSCLLICSDPDLAEWLELSLRKTDVKSIFASDIAHAKRIMRKIPINNVLLDADGEYSNGERMIEELQNCPGSEGLPLYVMTCLPEAILDKQSLAGVLKKPFSLHELLEIFNKHT